MSGRHAEILRRVDGLYEHVVSAPESWNDAQLAEWSGDVMGDGAPPGRETARQLRRVMRMAQRLRDFWADPPPGVPSDGGDWRTRVDIAFGIRAWRPTLAIAEEGLRRAPSEELFDEMRSRFRLVHGTVWMEGTSYEEWLASAE